MSTPTRFTQGVTNAAPGSAMGRFIDTDPTLVHRWFDDFDKYTAGDWTVTATGSGTSAISNADNGVLLLTNAAADDDARFLQWTRETFKFVAGKKLWFKARIQVSDATQSDFVLGLQITDTTPLAVSDGVYFRKDDGDANLDFVVVKDSTATTATAASTITAATWTELAFYYDGVSSITAFKDDVPIATSVTTNLVDDEELTISFGVQNGEAVAKTMSIDYILVAKQR
jgi:hypothetical protein